MERLTKRTSTIFISVDGRTEVYRSVEEIPPRLRQKLMKSTSGANSATILIADEKGREEIVRSLRGLPSDVQSRLIASLVARSRQIRPAASALLCSGRPWAEIVMIGAFGLLLWLLFTWK